MSAERGFALLVSLVVLLALTLLAVSSINMTQVDLRIVGNTQSQLEAEDTAAAVIEELLSNPASFEAGTSTSNNVTYSVACMEQRTQPGYSLTITDPPPPEIAYWSIRAVMANADTNAQVVINQGVRMPMLAENPDCI